MSLRDMLQVTLLLCQARSTDGGRGDASLIEAAEVKSSLDAVSCQMQDQAKACSPTDQPVRKFKDGLGINMTTKKFFTFRTE